LRLGIAGNSADREQHGSGCQMNAEIFDEKGLIVHPQAVNDY